MDRGADLQIREMPGYTPGFWERYASVPISFEVRTLFVVRPMRGGLDGLVFDERFVAAPYWKDYDAIPGEGPLHWAESADMTSWGIFVAFLEDRYIGGAVVAWKTPGVDMLEGRDDRAVLWDLRVHPEYRGSGVGHRLFAAVEDWARYRECRLLKVETQNINVPACRFYARQGCELRSIRQYAYPDLPDEIQLFWYKEL